MEVVRLDKWLWSTRFFKTRSYATEACKRNHIKVNEAKAKPSRYIKTGDNLEIRKGPLLLSVKVTCLIDRRVSAQKAKECYNDLTAPEKYLDAEAESKRFRSLAKGKPSRKQRQELEDFFFGELS
jgi:ribosome-associated heat shock protein Hsp15